MKKCIVEGCANTGLPEVGYDFFLCDGCMEKLELQLARRDHDERVRTASEARN